MYTPQFSDKASVSIRRFAWAINMPMTATVELMVKLLPTIIDPQKVCQTCKVKDKEKYRDKYKEKCMLCIFTKKPEPEDLAALEAVI